MRLRAGRLPVEIHPLLPLMLLLALQTGLGKEALAVLPALFVHEAGHLIAARACGLATDGLSLTPFGAVIRMKQAWNAQPWRIVCMSLAGPAANLLLLAAIATAAYAGAVHGQTARLLIWPNLLLMLVNLLPALPLDGGRALCALLTGRLGVCTAVRVFAAVGYTLAALIVLSAVRAGITQGVWNITLLGSAAYLCAGAAQESASASGANAQAFVFRSDELRRRGSLPVRVVAVAQGSTLAQAMSLLRPGCVHLFLLLDEAMRPAGVVSEPELLCRYPAEAASPLRSIPDSEKRRKFLQTY